MTHKLENYYTTEVHPVDWRFWTPHQASQPEGQHGRRNSQRIRLWRWVVVDCRTSTGLGEAETVFLESTHKVVCASGPRGKEQWPHKRPNQTYLLVLEGLLQRQGVAVAHRKDKDTGSRSSGKYSLTWALLESPLAPPKSLQAPLLGRLRPNNQQGVNSAPPISRQVG